MSIRTFRNKVQRARFGLAGLRATRGPRRFRRSLTRLAKREAEQRVANARAAKLEAMREANRPKVAKPTLMKRVMRALGFGKRIGG